MNELHGRHIPNRAVRSLLEALDKRILDQLPRLNKVQRDPVLIEHLLLLILPDRCRQHQGNINAVSIYNPSVTVILSASPKKDEPIRQRNGVSIGLEQTWSSRLICLVSEIVRRVLNPGKAILP